MLGVALVWAALAATLSDQGPQPTAPADEVEMAVAVDTFTVIEGERREDIAARLNAETTISGEDYLELTDPGAQGRRLSEAGEPRSLEGFLFPATYDLTAETTAADLVRTQTETYRGRVSDIDFQAAAARNLTPYDVLIIASMIEREVADPEERELVASVIYNRLSAGMMLGIDATVQYAIGDWASELTVTDLEIDSPYNTRRFVGLPPGPIASPGEASIRAAASPADTDFLYYVARADGSDRHYFSEDADTFARDVQRAQQNAAAG